MPNFKTKDKKGVKIFEYEVSIQQEENQVKNQY